MKCPRCQHENLAGSSFCLDCGGRLALTCASCGTDLPVGSKFCNKCGNPISDPAGQPRFVAPESYTPKHLAEKILTSKAALEGERKQVTVLFADLKGSSLPEAMACCASRPTSTYSRSAKPSTTSNS